MFAGMYAAVVFFCTRVCARILRSANERRARQSAFDLTYFSLLLTYFITVCFLIGMPSGPADWISGWLVTSAEDANVVYNGSYAQHRSVDVVPPPLVAQLPVNKGQLTRADEISLFVISFRIFSSLTVFCATFGWISRRVQLWTLFVQRLSVRPEWGRISEAFVQAAHTSWRRFPVKEAHPLMRNVMRTFTWFVICYLGIFLLIAVAPGDLGYAVVNWLDASIIDAGFHTGTVGMNDFGAPSSLHMWQLRTFLAAVIAMYGAVPAAVTLCVFLPISKPREIATSAEALVVPSGLRAMRAWSDVANVDIAQGNGQPPRRSLQITFRSGGKYKLPLRCLSDVDLNSLLRDIDEFADNCLFSDETLKLRIELSQRDRDAIRAASSDKKKLGSTIFVAPAEGEQIAGKDIRVICTLASKALTVTCLVRTGTRLAILKRFVLPCQTPENQALKARFMREYELLKSLDHPIDIKSN
jgi:hypothetical protein